MEAAATTTAPRRYYGWTMVAVTGLAAVATSPGQSFLIGRFNPHLARDAGLDEAALSVAYMIGTFASGALLTFVGTWSDRRGPRRLAAFAAIGLGLACGFFAGGLASGFALVTIGFFLLRFTAQGCLMLASTHALALWFDRRLGLAESIRLATFAVGMMVLPPIVVWGIDGLGHRGTFAAMGAIVWLVLLPIVWLLWRNRPADVGQAFVDKRAGDESGDDAPAVGLTLGGAVRTPAFWIYAGVVAYFAALGTAMLFHAEAVLVSGGATLGRASAIAATCVTTWAAVGFAFHFVAGQLVDRLPAGWLLAGVALALGAAAALFAAPESAWRAVAGFAVLGVGHGTITTIGSPVVVRHFGRRSIGGIKGLLSTIGVGVSGAGPAAIAVLAAYAGTRDAPSFAPAMWASAAFAPPLALAALFLRKPAWPADQAADLSEKTNDNAADLDR